MIDYKPQIKLLSISEVTQFNSKLFSYYYIGKANDKYTLPKSVFYHYSYLDTKKPKERRIVDYKRFLFESYNKLNPYFQSEKMVDPTELWKITDSIQIRLLLDEMVNTLVQGNDIYLLDDCPVDDSHGNCIRDALNYFANNRPKISVTNQR